MLRVYICTLSENVVRLRMHNVSTRTFTTESRSAPQLYSCATDFIQQHPILESYHLTHYAVANIIRVERLAVGL